MAKNRQLNKVKKNRKVRKQNSEEKNVYET